MHASIRSRRFLRRATRPAHDWRRGGPLFVGLATVAVYVLYSAMQWRRLESPSWDLGIFTQLAEAYARLQSPVVPIKGVGFNLLGDHFHPLLVLLGPIYALAPSAFTLLVVQDVLIGVSAYAIARTAARALGDTSGTVLGAAYAVSWGVQAAVAAQFHEVAFAAPLLAFGLGALLERRWTASALWLAPLVFVKEDLGITVAVLGLVITARGSRTTGLGLATWGVFWTATAMTVVLPHFNPDGHYAYGGRLAVGPRLLNPLDLLDVAVGDPAKVATLGLLVAAGGLIFLRSPIAVALLPTILWRFLSEDQAYWSSSWHYSLVLMPILFAAVIEGITRSRQSTRPWLRRYSRVVVAVAATVAVMVIPGRPLEQLGHAATYRPSDRWSAAHAAMARIPAGATVETDIGLMAYLVASHRVEWIGTSNPPPQYVLLDNPSSWSPPTSVERWAERHHPRTRYRAIFRLGHYEVARRIDRALFAGAVGR